MFTASGDPGTSGQGLGGEQVSVLVVGLSHKSAPVAVLERAAVSGDALTKLLRDVVQAEPVAEAFVVSTCNRVEVYAEVDRFHAGVTAICELLARHCGVPSHELTQYLYVHYEDRAVSHLLAVAAGLDSMVVGEDQILGQVRSAVKLAAEHGTAGRVLGELGRLALRTGKRARAETAIGRAGLSLLSAYFGLGVYGLVIQFGIAATQAGIVFILFMRLKGPPSLKWVFAFAGFFWLSFLYGLSTMDYATRRGWP